MKGFKTIGYVAATILGVLAVPQVQELIAQYPVTATFINGTVVLGLRWVTTSPIFNK
jgi:hypothetical protein